ncbi:hypothetical protein QBC46DRAFT_174639 [Diplogelasinospora grovesii]|uniref:Uncharacterized protein n=1 Tax=Diplogelasinospora grovesii TaxID=303347 RepID=A0AAN6N2I0_9PEZI|nr:hypothetical protein QBC46DRAFT_174639 [Diplogelasinospora grovesii]
MFGREFHSQRHPSKAMECRGSVGASVICKRSCHLAYLCSSTISAFTIPSFALQDTLASFIHHWALVRLDIWPSTLPSLKYDPFLVKTRQGMDHAFPQGSCTMTNLAVFELSHVFHSSLNDSDAIRDRTQLPELHSQPDQASHTAVVAMAMGRGSLPSHASQKYASAHSHQEDNLCDLQRPPTLISEKSAEYLPLICPTYPCTVRCCHVSL